MKWGGWVQTITLEDKQYLHVSFTSCNLSDAGVLQEKLVSFAMKLHACMPGSVPKESDGRDPAGCGGSGVAMGLDASPHQQIELGNHYSLLSYCSAWYLTLSCFPLPFKFCTTFSCGQLKLRIIQEREFWEIVPS